MNNQWRSAQWLSGERAEPKRSLLSLVKPYLISLYVTPIKLTGFIIALIVQLSLIWAIMLFVLSCLCSLAELLDTFL